MTTITLDPRTVDVVRNHCGTHDPEQAVALPRAHWHIGGAAFVRAFGQWRGGVIVKVGTKRATVAYVTPSNRALVRFATSADVRIGEFWTPARCAGCAVPCDHCGAGVHRDGAGYWVGADEASDCVASDRGHEVDGSPR